MHQVTIMRDITLNFVPLSTAPHDFAPIPPAPAPPPMLGPSALAYESITNAWWPPGMALGQNKFTSTVYHQGQPIALQNHDCGTLIPHVQIVPAPSNVLTLAIHLLFSSRKDMFAAGQVQMNGKPTACMNLHAWPPGPMLFCANPVSLPVASSVTALGNSVVVGMSWLDVILGWATIAATMALDWACRTKAPGELSGSFGSAFLGEVVPSSFGSWTMKQGIGALQGLTRIAAGEPGEAKVGIGAPFLQVEVTALSRDQEGVHGPAVTGRAALVEGKVSTQGSEVTVNDPVGEQKWSRNYGEEMQSSSTHSNPLEGFDTTSTQTDQHGNVTSAESAAGGGGGGAG